MDILNSNRRNKSLVNVYYLKLAEIDILQFINQLDSCSQEFKRVMCKEVKPLVLNFPIEVFDKLEGMDRVKYILFLNDQWDNLISLIISHKQLNDEIKDLKASNRKLYKSLKKKRDQLNKQRNVNYVLGNNYELNQENKALKREIKVIKSTKGWLKYKTNNIYLRLFKKI